MVCNDAKKFRMKVNDVERIVSHMRTMGARRINNLTLEINNNFELKNIVRSIEIDKPKVRFMCGHCTKVNEYELNRAFDEFKNLYINLVVALMNTDDEDYFSSTKYKLICLLRGYFPSCVRQLDRISFKDK